MAEPYVGEIRAVGFNFVPADWLPCNGSLQSIANYEVLYTLIGTTYGGDGVNTFGLPNLQGRVPIGFSSSLPQGVTSGEESVTITQSTMPQHSHTLACNSGQGNQVQLAGGFPAAGARQVYGPTDNSTLAANSVSVSGSSLSHENRQPYLTINFIISPYGIFPTSG
jgi:microcystin-dependent protein